MRTVSFGLAVLACLPLGQAALSATIESTSGQVLLNRGEGFLPTEAGSPADVGTTIMVQPGGTAVIVYSDGCRVNAEPGKVFTVTPLSPCAV